MITLRNWYLSRYDDLILGYGLVSSNHPRCKTDEFIHTSPVTMAVAEDGKLRLTTFSGNQYTLKPEWFNPLRRVVTAACLPALGVEDDFLERCVRAREEADARRRAEAAELLEPGELLLEVIGLTALQALFRTGDGALVPLRPRIHAGMHSDSVLITDWKGRTVDFRYFPRYIRIEPYHSSDGLRTIRLRNLGEAYTLFGREGKEVVCPAGEITAIPAAEYVKEGLLSPDAVNGKSLLLDDRLFR